MLLKVVCCNMMYNKLSDIDKDHKEGTENQQLKNQGIYQGDRVMMNYAIKGARVIMI